MRIEIAERLRPFSHEPGAMALLPATALAIQAFPARLHVLDLSGLKPVVVSTVNFSIVGPVDDFTVQQDLERGVIRIWGKGKNGFFRYRVISASGGVDIVMEKAPEGLFGHVAGDSQEYPLVSGSVLSVELSAESLRQPILLAAARLSLGNHKTQDWELIRRRGDFTEIFPLWYALGQSIRCKEAVSGVAALLKDCREAIVAGVPENILGYFRALFLAAFGSMLVPRLEDHDFHGIEVPSLDSNEHGSPLHLLAEGARLISSLFVQQDNSVVRLLPALPPEFHCGRFLNVVCEHGTVSIEWSKKAIRRMVFYATVSAESSFIFSHGVKECRLRCSEKDQGRPYCSEESLILQAGKNYWFDNFRR